MRIRRAIADKGTKMESSPITPVILSGGSGTRLWPLSRPEKPKQFHALGGKATLLQRTALRLNDARRFGAPLIVAGAVHVSEIETQLSGAGISAAAILVEPVSRNTAAAIALAALWLDPDEIMLVTPSDHLIEDEQAFLKAVDAAVPWAREDWLVTFGVTPTRPDTGFGYIRIGLPLDDHAYQAVSFVEKPTPAGAASLLADGGHCWNAGIFLFRAGAFLDALHTHTPTLSDAVRAAFKAGRAEDAHFLADPRAFEKVQSISVDHAVMEKANRIAVVPVEMRWSDVGSWDAVYDNSLKDDAGNVVDGQVLAIDTRGCLLQSQARQIVTIGIENLLVIETGDAILIASRGQSQHVRRAIELLQQRAPG